MSWSAVRTVAVLELRQRVRSTRWQVMLIVWGAVLVLLFGGMCLLAGTTGGDVEDTAPYLYDMTVCFVLAIGLIVAPTLSASPSTATGPTRLWRCCRPRRCAARRSSSASCWRPGRLRVPAGRLLRGVRLA